MPIANVTLSNTFDEWRIRHNVITVNVNALQNTATGLNYTVANTVNAFLNIRSGDGTESLPAITNFGDTSTGIYFPSNGQIAFSANGVDAISVDSTRNVTFSNTVTFKTFDVTENLTLNNDRTTFNSNVVFNSSVELNDVTLFNANVAGSQFVVESNTTFYDSVDFQQTVTFNDTSTFVANTDFEGLVRLKNTVTLSSHVIPSANATYDLGTAANGIGTLYANNVQTDNFDINNSGNNITSIEHNSDLAGGDSSIPTSRAASEYADNQAIAFAIALG